MTLNGSNLMLFITKGDKTASVAYATNHTLEVSADTKDISTKDSGNGIWSNAELGMMNWSTSTENLCSDAAENGFSYNDLFDIFLSRSKVKLVFGLQSNMPSLDVKDESSFNVPSTGWTPDTANNYTGEAYITSLSLTATNGEKANFTAQFSGAGPLVRVGDGFQSKKK